HRRHLPQQIRRPAQRAQDGKLSVKPGFGQKVMTQGEERRRAQQRCFARQKPFEMEMMRAAGNGVVAKSINRPDDGVRGERRGEQNRGDAKRLLRSALRIGRRVLPRKNPQQAEEKPREQDSRRGIFGSGGQREAKRRRRQAPPRSLAQKTPEKIGADEK